MERKFLSSKIELVDIVDPDYQHYFYTLLKAIESVDYVKYVSNAGNHAISDVPEVELRIGELLERTFAYELYRQWLNLLEKEKSHLTINAEVTKEISLMPNEDVFTKYFDGSTNFPDLILHKSHDTLKDNTFVCEIKRHEKMIFDEVACDISKLCAFLSHKIWEGNPYKYGFFLVIRDNLYKIKDVLDDDGNKNENRFYNELRNYKRDLFKRIICISYNDNTITYDSLFNVLDLEEHKLCFVQSVEIR